jgi:hypothetical protein
VTHMPKRMGYAPRTISLLLALWSLNTEGKCPSMIEVIMEENGGVRPMLNTIESRRQLLRVAIYHGLISKQAIKPGESYSLLITPAGVEYLRRNNCTIEPPQASPSLTPES